ncbi:hypothetical protein ACFP1Z_10435 [Streptomyces gamaensis]|uniref:Dickkopf N-terminal cysteine-rich domain-containing protein n=1 Tax=Streptomyces gamaensis TaxID=1763542 RepID=A0ABW0YYU1_9ACTN
MDTVATYERQDIDALEELLTDIFIAPTACQEIGQHCETSIDCCGLAECDLGICQPIPGASKE